MTAKDIPFQKCEVDLTTKAQWHLDINGGLIPLLETPDGNIIYESAVLMDFANSFGAGNGYTLWPHEASPGDLTTSMQTGAMKLQMLKFDKLLASFWPAFSGKLMD